MQWTVPKLHRDYKLSSEKVFNFNYIMDPQSPGSRADSRCRGESRNHGFSFYWIFQSLLIESPRWGSVDDGSKMKYEMDHVQSTTVIKGTAFPDKVIWVIDSRK